jgi:hypothetical protein
LYKEDVFPNWVISKVFDNLWISKMSKDARCQSADVSSILIQCLPAVVAARRSPLWARGLHHCTVLHCTALHCTALHCTAPPPQGPGCDRDISRHCAGHRTLHTPINTALHTRHKHCTALHWSRTLHTRHKHTQVLHPFGPLEDFMYVS